MIPINKDFLNWLDDDGELREDSPKDIKKQYNEWKKHYEEWEKEIE